MTETSGQATGARVRARETALLPAVSPSRSAPVACIHGVILALALLFLSGLRPFAARAQSATILAFDAPKDGAILRGIVEIRGSAHGASFRSAELAFGYADDLADTWFTIAEITQPVQGDELAMWDTTLVSDGDYVLRLQLSTMDGVVKEVFANIQVRNYTGESVRNAAASSTSPPMLRLETPVLMPSPSTVLRIEPASPTPLPMNDAALAATAVAASFWKGALAITAVSLGVAVIFLRRRR